jgi:hypothetical protein
LTKVDVKMPLMSTVEVLRKLLPLMVNSTWSPPAVVLAGESEVIDGATGQEQDTAVASAITSTHKIGDFAAVGTGARRWRTRCDKRGAGKVRAIQEKIGEITGTSQPGRERQILHA